MDERFVLDNSIVMSWCFIDESNTYSDAILEKLKETEAIVPSIWPLEVGNVLLVAERNKRLSEADSTRFISLLYELPIIVDQEAPERMLGEIFALAREHSISTYDASYLDLAMRHGLSIATGDKSILRAAKRSKVPVVK
jgi:predicted nucleic acid-binding protein